MDSEIDTSTPVSQSQENGGGDSTVHVEAPLVEDDYETASESDDIIPPVGKDFARKEEEDENLDVKPVEAEEETPVSETVDKIEENGKGLIEVEKKEDENLDVKPVEAEEETPVSETVDKIEENGKGLIEVEKKEEALVGKGPSSDEEVVSESTVMDEEQFQSEPVEKSHVSMKEANLEEDVAPKGEEEKQSESNVVEVGSVMELEKDNRSTTDIDTVEKEGELKPKEDVLNVDDVEKIDSAAKSVEVAKEEEADVGEIVVPLVKEEKDEPDNVEESKAVDVEGEDRSSVNIDAVEKEVDLKDIEVELDANDAMNVHGAVESNEVAKEDTAKVEESSVPIVGQEKKNESDIIEVSSVIEAEEGNKSASNIDVIEKERDLKPIEVELCANDVEEVDSVVELNEVAELELKNVVEEEKTQVEEVSEAVVDTKNVDNEKLDDVTESKVIDEREDDAMEEESKVVFEALDAIQNDNEVDEFDAVDKDIVVVETKKEEVTELETEDRAVLNAEATPIIIEDSDNAESTFVAAKVSSDDNAESPSIILEDSQSNEKSPSQLTKDPTEDASSEAVIPHEISIESTPQVDKTESDTAANDEYDDEKHSSSRVAILDSSELAKQLIKEMGENSSRTSFESSKSYQNQIDGQIVTDSDEEGDSDEEEDNNREMFDSAALAALLKAATGGGDSSSDGRNITITSQDGTRVFSMDRPAGLGSSAPSLRPGPARSARPTLFPSSELAVTPEPDTEMDEEERKLHENVEQIRVKFLRLINRLGCSAEDSVAAQVLYRLSLAEGIRRGRQTGRAFSVESAKKKALQLEEEGEEALNFSCNILVLGKTGVGKSATINSIFGEEKAQTNAFKTATTSVREISSVVDGVKIRVIDTPGLKSSVMDQAENRKILSSIKKYTKKCPPDIVLYVDRLDTQTRDFNDLPLLKSITAALGPSTWFSAIVALTHAASAPPDGPNGSPLSYEVFVAQRSHVVQQNIRQAAGDMRLMNPVALVENHPSCRRNREGERVLPNGVSWRPQMLLLCYSSKILAEANSLLKLQDPSPGKLFGFRVRSPPLPYLLSTLLQTRTHPKLPNEQGDNGVDSDIDLDEFDFDDFEEEDEYDSLPPFKPLKKSQLEKLSKEQKRAYFDEYDYRVKLLQKKQLKDEIRRLKEMKKRGKSTNSSEYPDLDNQENEPPAAIPVPMPDMVLPPSFDSDVPTYRYRFLEPTSQLLTRPVLDPHGWDHDCGYDGVSLEETLALAGRFPAAVAVQITKDKKDFSIHLDSSVAAKYNNDNTSVSTLAGFDVQTVGKQLAYILRGETKFKNFKKNRTTVGGSVTFLGENVATGLKVEDQVTVKRVGLVGSAGAIRSQGDVAYGANLEARLKEKDNPVGQAVCTLGLSLMKWRGDLALGANMQTQADIGRSSKVALRVSLNNKRSGQITVRTSSTEQLQLALVAVIPIVVNAYKNLWASESEY